MRKLQESGVIVTESITGVWSYHLSKPDNFIRSLCGRNTMRCGITLETWGQQGGHIPMSFCKACEAAALGETPERETAKEIS